MKAKQNNTKKFIDPATFPHVAGLLGNKNRAKAWLTTETARNFSQRYFFDISKMEKYPFRIHFSDDNRKMDGIPTFAFNPFLTCPGMPCLGACYATKGTFLTVNKLKTEVENTAYYFFNKKQFLKELDAYLTLNELFFPYFRYFDGGDFVSAQNVKDFLEISKKHPKIKFLIRTKKADFVKACVKNRYQLPANVVLRLSNFSFSNFSEFEKQNDFLTTDCKKNPGKGPNVCPGSKVGCRRCLMCWNKNIENITFEKH